jgi:hypothetical protein
VIDPELEVWVWSNSPRVADVLGWQGRSRELNEWLRTTTIRIGKQEREYLKEGETKPVRPKEAMEAALREVRKPRSSANFRQMAEKVSLEKCQDPAFRRLKSTLQQWFPVR